MPKLVGKCVFRLILAHTLVLKCRCARHIFKSYRKCVAMVTAHYSKNWRKQSISNESWHRCWPRSVNVQYTFFFYSNGMCVAMVTTYANNCEKRCFQIKFGTTIAYMYTCARHPWRVADSKLPRFPFAVSLLSVNSVC